MYDNYQQNNYNQQSPNTPTSPKVLRFDKSYIKTIPGVLKIVELVCNLIGFICIKVSNIWVSAILYNLLYWLGNLITGVLFLMYLFHFVEKYDKLPWLKVEFGFCAVMVLSYIGTSIFAATLAESGGYAVGFFGLCAIIAYSYDGYLKYKAMKRGLPPQ